MEQFIIDILISFPSDRVKLSCSLEVENKNAFKESCHILFYVFKLTVHYNKTNTEC